MPGVGYFRVIPRDLFNEANLLKCYGQLRLNLGEIPELQYDGQPFVIEQDADGGLSIANVRLLVDGQPCSFYRPLNSRRPFALYCTLPGSEAELEVFDDTGNCTLEFLRALRDRLAAP